jgi:hypothetical protein
MILAVLFSLFTCLPSVDFQQESKALTAVDYFPADTAFLIEVRLEPWFRLGDQTAANQLFSIQSILDVLLPQAEAWLQAEEEAFADLDFEQAFAGMTFYLAGTRSMYLKDQGLIAVEFHGDEAKKVLSKMAEMPEPHVIEGNTFLKLMSMDDQPIAPDYEQAFLDGLVIEAHAPPEAAQAPTRLVQLPSWQRMQKQLVGGNRIVGIWIPIETWKDGFFVELAQNAIQAQSDPSLDDFVLTAMPEMVELGKMGGAAMVTEIEPPYIRDRILLLDGGLHTDLFLPFALDPKQSWKRLAACDGDAVVAKVGGFHFQGLMDYLLDFLIQGLAAQGIADQAELGMKKIVPPIQAFVQELQPGFIQQSSSFRNPEAPFSQLTLTFGNADAAQAAVADFPPELKMLRQMWATRFGGNWTHQWNEESLTLFADPEFTGASDLGEQKHFQETLPAMKAAVADRELLWVSYHAPELTRGAAAALLAGWQQIVDEVGMPADFPQVQPPPKLPPAEALLPGFTLLIKQDESWMVESKSALGLTLLGLAEALAMVSEVQSGQAEADFNEDEF